MAGRLLLLFILLPLIEIWLLIEVGTLIGPWWTILIIVGTAIVGSQLVRRQGMEVFRRVQEHQRRGEVPAIPMLEGLALLLAGLCLIMPGLITGAIGFLLLIPPLRAWAARRLLSRMVVMQANGSVYSSHGAHPGHRQKDQHGNTVIEGDYERRHDDD